ncbi:MAG: acyltransferase family protein, partial [Phycicoccus sp.]
LGYLWRDGTLDRPARHLPLVAGSVAGLALLTGPGPYPVSMVASAEHTSNMLPTTPPVLLVGVLQVALVLAARPVLARFLSHATWWRPVLGVNLVAMSTYLWHMPVVALLVWASTSFGATLPATPDSTWWWTRPLWLAAVLALLVPVLLAVRRWDLAGDLRR